MLRAHPALIQTVIPEFTCQLVVYEPAHVEEHVDEKRELKHGEGHKHRPVLTPAPRK